MLALRTPDRFVPRLRAPLAVAAATAAALVATAAHADVGPGGLRVSPLAYSGDGCPDGSVLGSLGDDGTYGIIFADFAASSSPGALAAARCDVRVDVRLPVNYRMRVASVAIQGKVDAPGASGVQLFTDYAMNDYRIGYDLDPKHGLCKEHYQPTPETDAVARDAKVASIGGIPSAQGNWQITWSNQDAAHFTACGGQVSFTGSVSARADAAGGDDAEIAVQRFDAALRYSLGWGWRFEKCLDVLNGQWRASLQEADGRVHPASMAIAFHRGSVSGSGAPLLLSAVEQEDTLVTATWRRGADSGWLRLRTPATPPLNVMQGEWGRGIDPGENVIGTLTAERVL
jgi:hypothetical protein